MKGRLMGGFVDAITGGSAKEARRQARQTAEQNRIALARNEQSVQNQEADTRGMLTAAKKAPRGKRLLLGDTSSTLGS